MKLLSQGQSSCFPFCALCFGHVLHGYRWLQAPWQTCKDCLFLDQHQLWGNPWALAVFTLHGPCRLQPGEALWWRDLCSQHVRSCPRSGLSYLLPHLTNKFVQLMLFFSPKGIYLLGKISSVNRGQCPGTWGPVSFKESQSNLWAEWKTSMHGWQDPWSPSLDFVILRIHLCPPSPADESLKSHFSQVNARVNGKSLRTSRLLGQTGSQHLSRGKI